MIHLTEKGLIAESNTTIAEFEAARLVSLKDATSGEEFLNRKLSEEVPGFELLRQNGKNAPLGVHPLASKVHYTLLTDRIAEFVLELLTKAKLTEKKIEINETIHFETGKAIILPESFGLLDEVSDILRSNPTLSILIEGHTDSIGSDTANLILYGKANPVDGLDVIGKYVRSLHAKDSFYPTNPRELGKEVPIGEGKVDFPRLIKRLRELNYHGAMTNEREISGPRQIEDVKKAMAYLQKLLG
jgi:hypothetical protein